MNSCWVMWYVLGIIGMKHNSHPIGFTRKKEFYVPIEKCNARLVCHVCIYHKITIIVIFIKQQFDPQKSK